VHVRLACDEIAALSLAMTIINKQKALLAGLFAY
jgi:hypothetical protein